jgi:hypothetical protein
MVNVIKRQDDITSAKFLKLKLKAKRQCNSEEVKNTKIQAFADKFNLDDQYDLVDYMLDLSSFCKNFSTKKKI